MATVHILLIWLVMTTCLYVTFAIDLFVSTETGIYIARSMVNNTSLEKLNTNDGNGFLVGLATDIRENLMFWSDESNDDAIKGIWKATISGTSLSSKSRIVHYDGMNVYGLAVDWIYKHLYWTDSNLGVVKMSDYQGQAIVDVVAKNLLSPRGLGVDPIGRFLYVGDQGAHLMIKCRLDGSHCSIRQDDALTWPNQITIDYAYRQVLVTDGWTADLFRCSLDSDSCTQDYIPLPNMQNTIFGVTVTPTGTFVSTFQNLTLLAANSSELNEPIVFNSDNEKSFYILSKDEMIQPDDPSSHPCTKNNGGCPELCVPGTGQQYTCTCSSNKVLVQKKCQSQDETLLYLDRNRGVIGIMSPVDLSSPGLTIIASSRSPYAMTFVPNEKNVYFSDVQDSSIYRIKFGEAQATTFMCRKDGVRRVTDITYDILQRRLYFINEYCNEDGQFLSNCVEMTNLSKSKRRRIICSEEKYTSLYIERRYLLLATEAGISRMTLDGLGKVKKHTFSNRVPHFAFTSFKGNIVLGEFSGSANSVSLRNLDFQADTASSTLPLQTAKYYVMTKSTKHDTLYVGDPDSGHIIKLQIGASNAVTSVINATTNVQTHQLLYINTASVPIPDNGRCDDGICGKGTICFQKPDSTSVTCLCSSYKFNILDNDRKTCKVPRDYIIFTSKEGLQMIATESTDTSVYTLVNGDNSNGFYGLTKDNKNNRVYFSEYEGRIIYSISMNDPVKKINVVTVQRTNRIRNIVFSNGKIFWTGLYDDPENNSTGAIFSTDVSGDNNVTELVSDINNPLQLEVNPSFIFWMDGNVYKILDRERGTTTPINVPQDVTVQSIHQDGNGRIFYTIAGNNYIYELYTSPSFMNEAFHIDGGIPKQINIKGLSIFIAEQPAGISSFDIRTRQRRVLNAKSAANNLIAFVSKKDINFEKPGKCGAVEQYRCNAPGAQKIQCLTDYDCLQSDRSKCCGDYSCRVCTPAVKTDDTCEISLPNAIKIMLRKGDSFRRSDCKTCSCENPSCSNVVCPTITCKDEPVLVPGSCCKVCTSLSSCRNKPKFQNCPANGTLEFTLPSMDHAVELSQSGFITIDQNHPKLRNVRAVSCSGQSLAWKFEATSFTWQKEPQQVKLIAEDTHGRAECVYQLVLNDNTDPRFIIFPSNAKAFAKTRDGVRVKWIQPKAYDNSGLVSVTSDRQNGDLFPLSLSRVTYTATDGSGNKIIKSFSVQVELIKDLKCENPPAIANGYIECVKSLRSPEQSCIIKCQNGFRFNSEDFEMMYSCGSDGVYRPMFKDNVVSSCFRPQPTIVGVTMSQVFNCPNANFTLTDIIECLKIVNLCPDPSTEFELCDLEHLSGETIRSKVILNATVTGKLSFGVSKRDEDKLKRDLNKQGKTVLDFFKFGTFARYCPSIGCKLSTSSDVTELPTSCATGSVSHNIDGKNICAKCPGGTFYKDRKCHKCAANYYQDLEGQVECKKCPSPKKYSKEGSWLVSSCSAVSPLVEKPEKKDSASSSGIPFLPIGIALGVVILIIAIVIIVVIVIKKSRKSRYLTNGTTNEEADHVNVIFNADTTDPYDVIPADEEPNDPYDIIGNVTGSNEAVAASSSKTTEDNNAYASIVKKDENEAPYDSLEKNTK